VLISYDFAMATRNQQQSVAVDEVNWLDEEEMVVWRAMVDVNASIQAAVEEDLTSHGLTAGDYGVLARLSDAPDRRLRMCDLASALHLSPSGLTRRVDGLVKQGLVSREPSENDRRVMLAVLSDEGIVRLRNAAPGHVGTVRRQFIDHLSRTQLRNLANALTAVQSGTLAE
jgi:hypothetical protein